MRIFSSLFRALFSRFCARFYFALASTNRKKAPGAHLWVLPSLIATESVQESSEKLPPAVVMTSLAYIGTRPSAARKLFPSRSLFSWTTKALPSPLYTILTLRSAHCKLLYWTVERVIICQGYCCTPEVYLRIANYNAVERVSICRGYCCTPEGEWPGAD